MTASHDVLPAVGSRRREVSPPSARSLLLTIFGEFVYPRSEPVWTSGLTAALGRFGIEEKSARQAIARSSNEGLIASAREGRRVRWSITQPGTRLLAEGTQRIYTFLTDVEPWDGRWLVLTVAIPETQRKLRHKLRTRLTWLGLGSPTPGLWISPDTKHEAEVKNVIDALGLEHLAFAWVGPLTEIGSASTLIDDAWSLDDVASQYRDFIGTYESATADSPEDAFVGQIRLVQDWRRFPFLDPALPPELLNNDWPGPAAAQLFHRRHDEWHAKAQKFWADLVG